MTYIPIYEKAMQTILGLFSFWAVFPLHFLGAREAIQNPSGSEKEQVVVNKGASSGVVPNKRKGSQC